jgi:hypothetical protein
LEGGFGSHFIIVEHWVLGRSRRWDVTWLADSA